MVNYARRDLDLAFAALGHPIRRGILARLASGEATVSQLAKPFQVSAPAITKHLRVLERAGLLARRRQGRVHRCRLEPARLAEAERWLAEQRRQGNERNERSERRAAPEPKQHAG